MEVLDELLSKYGKLDIFNKGQGCHFISADFADRLKEAGICISMDGDGRWMDNRFVERLWKSLKYEEVYLNGCDWVLVAEQRIGDYCSFYNMGRFHQALGYRTSDSVYLDRLGIFSNQAVA